MNAVFLVVATASIASGWLAGSASAAAIPTSYVVDEKPLKKNAPAGTTITFELHSDASCTTLIDSETESIENVVLRERIKPLKVAGDTTTVKNLVELRHTFSATPDAGSDLYVRATASVAEAIDTSTTLLGACQAQEPAGGTGASGGGGAIIPFASGLPVNTTTTGGVPDVVGIAGFGRSASVNLVGGTIDLSGGSGIDTNFAFSIPRDGVVTSISGFYSTSSSVVLIGTTVTIWASLYCSTIPDNTFTEVAGSAVALAAFTGSSSLGTSGSAVSSGLSIPVTAGMRCLAVYYSTAAGIGLNTTMSGYVSGGITIE